MAGRFDPDGMLGRVTLEVGGRDTEGLDDPCIPPSDGVLGRGAGRETLGDGRDMLGLDIAGRCMLGPLGRDGARDGARDLSLIHI